MCLQTVGPLNLRFSRKEGCFVGYGYKKMNSNIYTPSGHLSPTLIKKSSLGYAKKLEKGWYESTGTKSVLNAEINNKRLVDADRQLGSDRDSNSYYPGFHIFLNERDARAYRFGSGPIVKVMFREVTAFGKNSTSNGGAGDCVIAKYMKIVEKVDG